MSNARIYSNCPCPEVYSASNNFKSPDISDPVPVQGGVDIDRCINNSTKGGQFILVVKTVSGQSLT